MSEPEKASHWDSVADEIGVTPGADPPRPDPPHPDPPRPEAAPADTLPRQSSRKDVQRLPAGKSSGSDWNALAADLGVQPAASPKKPDPPKAVEPPRQDGPSTEQVPEATALDDQYEGATGVDTPEGGPVTVSLDVVEEQVDFGEPEPAGARDSDEEDSGTRRRRRRRPRRRATKKRPSEAGDGVSDEGVTPAAESKSETESESKTGSETETQTEVGSEVGSDADQAIADQPVAETDEEDPDLESATQRPMRPSHRNIPPWEEAVGVIVDANLEARASRSNTGRTRSRGGRGRGRKN